MILSHVCTVTAAILLLIVTCACTSAAEPASTWRAETERRWNAVVTWRGTAVIDESLAGSDAVDHWSCDFVIDRQRRCLRWINSTPGKEFTSAGIIKHGGLYRIGDRGAGTTVISVTGLSDRVDRHDVINVDPIEWLTAGITTAPVAFARPGGVLDLDGWQVDDAALPLFTLQRPERDSTIEVDPLTGNIASVRTLGPAFTDEMTLRWERQRDVWVPVEMTHRRAGPDGRLTHRHITFQKLIVNDPVDPGEWSLSQIGAQDGDVVRDELRRVQFVYHGENVIAPAMSASAERIAPRTLILNVAVWIVILGLILLEHRRRIPSGKDPAHDAAENHGVGDCAK